MSEVKYEPLKNTFFTLANKYSNNLTLINKLWLEIETNYSYKKRYYHNLTHLLNFLTQITLFKAEFENFDIALFSMYYHDIIYKATKKDNEEKSAELAVIRLKKLAFPEDDIEICKQQILATKGHGTYENLDTNLFLDADLSILGQDWELYELYYQQVRKEYAIYPYFMYKEGRKKVLTYFLDMERIFKTEQFFHKYEKQARKNLAKELELL